MYKRRSRVILVCQCLVISPYVHSYHRYFPWARPCGWVCCACLSTAATSGCESVACVSCPCKCLLWMFLVSLPMGVDRWDGWGCVCLRCSNHEWWLSSCPAAHTLSNNNASRLNPHTQIYDNACASKPNKTTHTSCLIHQFNIAKEIAFVRSNK